MALTVLYVPYFDALSATSSAAGDSVLNPRPETRRPNSGLDCLICATIDSGRG